MNSTDNGHGECAEAVRCRKSVLLSAHEQNRYVEVLFWQLPGKRVHGWFVIPTPAEKAALNWLYGYRILWARRMLTVSRAGEHQGG